MLPIYLIVYNNVVFLCHSSMANNLPWITISSTEMNYPIHSQHFDLIIMDFASKIVSLLYFWIKGSSCEYYLAFWAFRLISYFGVHQLTFFFHSSPQLTNIRRKLNFLNKKYIFIRGIACFQDNRVFNTMSYLQEQRICKFSIHMINLFKYRNNCIKIYLWSTLKHFFHEFFFTQLTVSSNIIFFAKSPNAHAR